MKMTENKKRKRKTGNGGANKLTTMILWSKLVLDIQHKQFEATMA